MCDAVMKMISSSSSSHECSWLQLLTAVMLLICGASKISKIVHVIMTRLDFYDVGESLSYLYFLVQRLGTLREDTHGEPGIYFVTARYEILLSSILDTRRSLQRTFQTRILGKQCRLTSEQRRIVNLQVSRTDVLKVNAFAGSGKTTTLVKFAEHRPGKRLLYLVFNVAVREHASKLFPKNTKVKSVHSLAYSKIGRKYQSKLKSDLKIPQVLNCLRKRMQDSQVSPQFANLVVKTLEKFHLSSSRTIGTEHLAKAARRNSNKIIEASELVWDLMKDRESNDLPMTHNGYLKLYHLSKPKLHET